MKPIITEMKDLSDSVEVYESKPNPFLVYTIYAVLAVLISACIWASVFKLDDVVKSDGIFRNADSVYDISSGVSGKISDCRVENGTYVKEGDILYVVSIDSLSDTIISYQTDLENINARLDILDAYEKALDNGTVISEDYKENPYYEEFVNRRALLIENIKADAHSTGAQKEIYQGNIASVTSTIEQYETKIIKLGQVKNCITSRNNSFGLSDSYYSSIVSGYISSYDYSKLQYDNKITECQRQIGLIEQQVEKADEVTDLESLKNQKESLQNNISTIEEEKRQVLSNLEATQVANIEQMIESCNENLITLNTNLKSAQLELDNIGNDISNNDVAILTEKGNLASEKIAYEDKKSECEEYLKSYNIKNDNCSISAPSSGYFYCSQNFKQGSYVQEGGNIGSIYPENESEFYAELYVDNSDIGKISEGQEVKFEIAAFPSSEYGYFTGTVSNISKDITVNDNTGSAYYVVKVKCDNMKLQNKDGDSATLKNGMACSGKIIIGDKTVMFYLLEKINLIG